MKSTFLLHANGDNNISFIYRSYAFTIMTVVLVSVLFPFTETVIWINGWNTGFFDVFFSLVTELGNGLVLIPFAILLLFRKVSLTLALATCAILEGLTVTVLKRFIFPMAQRPVNFLDPSAIHFVPGIEVHKMMSFPSGHTVTIFGLCVFLSLCYRNKLLSLLLLVIAVAVGISRVYLLEHFLIDVAFGAALGTSVGALVFHVFEKMNKPLWMENRLEIQFRMPREKSKSVGY